MLQIQNRFEVMKKLKAYIHTFMTRLTFYSMQFNHNVYYTEKPAMWEKNMKSVLNCVMLAKMSSDWKKHLQI